MADAESGQAFEERVGKADAVLAVVLGRGAELPPKRAPRPKRKAPVAKPAPAPAPEVDIPAPVVTPKKITGYELILRFPGGREAKQEISKREAPVAINSIAQQARPIGIGQSEFLRIQLMAESRRVKMIFPSILES